MLAVHLSLPKPAARHSIGKDRMRKYAYHLPLSEMKCQDSTPQQLLTLPVTDTTAKRQVRLYSKSNYVNSDSDSGATYGRKVVAAVPATFGGN